MLKVSSREYKVMLDHKMFWSRTKAIRAFLQDLQHLIRQFDQPPSRRRLAIQPDPEWKFDSCQKRIIRLLDTPDESIRMNRLIFRHRYDVDGAGHGSFTLKCRTEDRYMAEGKILHPAKSRKTDSAKFEEDIAAPFRSRFSHSVSIKDCSGDLPATLKDAGLLFPILGGLARHGIRCDGKTPLEVVRGLQIHERAYKGLTLKFGPYVKVSVALILWSHAWKSRSISAEFSFRYENQEEKYLPEAAELAFDFFAALQGLDWCLPGSTTKTQFAYGGE